MEQLKVRRKDPVVLNALVFLFFSLCYIYLQFAFRHQLSPFSGVYLRKSVELFWYVGLLLGVSTVLLWRHHRWAVVAFNLSVTLVTFKVLEGLFIEFNKVIAVALFFYLGIAYFFYQLLKQYFGLAFINPNYTAADLFGPLLYRIPCVLRWGDTEVPGQLTNWDEEGAFVRLERPGKPPRRVQILVSFRGTQFLQEAEVVADSLDSAGVGLKFQHRAKDLKVFNWGEFNELVQELGFRPERLR
jgi:hypothetical protein